MFKENKYTKCYYNIIKLHQSESGEVHHIIPKSLGGLDDEVNLVRVSLRAHLILHKLLLKMVKTKDHKVSMNYALFMMMNRDISKYSSRSYENSKKIISENMKLNNPMHDQKVLSKRIGQKRSKETKKRISEGNYRRWNKTARPLRIFNCPICDTKIKTRVPETKTCSRSCSAFLQHRK